MRWLQAMNKEGRAGTFDCEPLAGLSGSGGGSDEELDALLSWTGSLDYDAYRESWLSLATSTAHPQQSQSEPPS